MRKILILLALMPCASLAAAQAQSGAPAARPADSHKIDPEKEASIRELLEVISVKSDVDTALRRELENQRPALMAALPPGDYRERLVDLFFEKAIKKLSTDLFIAVAVPVYDRNFTTDEIKSLVKIYQTPLVRRSVTAISGATAEMLQKSRELGEELGKQAMLEVLAEHPDLREALEKASAAAQAPPAGVSAGVRGGGVSGQAPSAPSAPREFTVPEGSKRIRVSAGVQEAKLVNQVVPTYPILARQARIQGTVKLHAIIGRDGVVEQLEAVSGPPLLIPAAMEAVKQWRYAPTLLEGEPVYVETYIDVIFSLGDNPPRPQ